MESRADIGADAALVLAAVSRMHAADRQGRETLERLRAGLGEMAAAIGRAKAKTAGTGDGDAAAKAVDTAAMLDELEHLVDGMIEITVGESADTAAAMADTAHLAMELAEPPAEAPTTAAAATAPETTNADQVPTVSGVVSRLDPEQQTAEPAPASPREMAIAAAAAGPTVEMLKSLVEALNASIPAESFHAQRMGELPSTPTTAEAAAQDVIAAFARELTRGGAEHVAAPEPAAVETPEVAAVQESVQQESVHHVSVPDVQAAQDTQPATTEDADLPVFDVLVEFDPVEPQRVARAEAVEPAAEGVETIAQHVEALPAEALTAEGLPVEVSAPVIADADAAELPAAESQAEAIEAVLDNPEIPAEPVQPEAEQAVAEIAAPQATAEPVLAEQTPVEAAATETAPVENASIADAPIEGASTEAVSIEQAWPEDALAERALDDWPAMPYEASFEDTIAEPQPAVAAPAEPVAAAFTEPAATAAVEPATADAQPAQVSPTNDVVTYATELLARFEQMGAVPMMPPELGRAVIFHPRQTPATEAIVSEAAPAEPLAEPAAAEPLAVADTELLATESPAITQPGPVAEAPDESAIAIETQPVAAVEAQPDLVAETPPESFAKPEPTPEPAPEPELQPASEPGAASDSADWTAEFKLPVYLLPTVDVAPRAEAVTPAADPVAVAEPATDAVLGTTTRDVALALLRRAEAAAKENGAAEAFVEPDAVAAPEPAQEAISEPPPAEIAEPAPESVALSEPVAEIAAAPEPAVAPEPELVAASEPELVAAPEPELVAAPEPELIAAPEPELVAAPEPIAVMVPEPEPAPEPEPVAEVAPETPSEAATEKLPAVNLDADFDPDDFLFGTNGKPNGTDQPVATADDADASSHELAASGETGEAGVPPAAKVAADPLMSIKAMSPEERIALFS